MGTIFVFERSLAVEQLRDAGAILAFAMNGEALPVQHGGVVAFLLEQPVTVLLCPLGQHLLRLLAG